MRRLLRPSIVELLYTYYTMPLGFVDDLFKWCVVRRSLSGHSGHHAPGILNKGVK